MQKKMEETGCDELRDRERSTEADGSWGLVQHVSQLREEMHTFIPVPPHGHYHHLGLQVGVSIWEYTPSRVVASSPRDLPDEVLGLLDLVGR